MPNKVPKNDSTDAKLPLPVIISEEQHPVPVVITAPDGVTPVPVPSLGVEANTAPGKSAPVSGYVPEEAIPLSPAGVAGVPLQGTTTTTVTSTVPPAVMVTKEEGLVLAPTTTAADDKVTEGQRKINLIWESSQSIISVAITAAVIYCQIYSINSETLNNAFFFVVATYLQRTNHVRKGGVPPDTNGSYRGR